jgi:hypothetical protein
LLKLRLVDHTNSHSEYVLYIWAWKIFTCSANKFSGMVSKWIPLFGIVTHVIHASDVSALTKQYADDYCADATLPTEYSAADDILVDGHVGSPNYLEDVILDPACTDIVECLKEEQTALINTALRVGVGILLAVITLLFWIFMSPCACCECYRISRIWCCCRVSSRPGGRRSMRKGGIWILTSISGLFALGLIIVVIYAATYANKVNQGGKNLLCQTFSLASDALNGNSPGEFVDPDTGKSTTYLFIGSEQLSADINTLDGALADGSTELSEIDSTMAATTDLQYRLDSFAKYLTFANTILGLDTNMKVSDHECLACKACCGGGGSYMDQMTTVVQQSYAATLYGLRGEIEDNLTGDGLDSVRTSLGKADQMVTDINSRFETSVGQNLIDNKSTMDMVMTASYWSIVALLTLIIIPTMFLALNMIFGVWLDNREPSDHTVRPPNPLLASCGWCWTFFYAMFILLVAGGFGVVGYFEGSVCQMTADSDTFIDNVYFRIESDAQDNNSTMSSADIQLAIDTCFKSTGSGDLLDAIVIDDTTNSTAQDILSFATVLNNNLDIVYAPSSSPKKMVDEPVFQHMIWALRNFNSLFFLPASTITTLKSLAGADPAQSLLDSGFGGVPDCSGRSSVPVNGTIGAWIVASLEAAGASNIPTDFSAGSATNLPGSSTYYSDAQTAGQNTGSSGTTCPSYNPSSVNNAPWDTLMIDKMGVLNKSSFRCDTITITRSSDDFAIDSTSEVSCTFAQFTTYITSLADELVAQAVALDVAAADTAAQIDENIRGPLQDTIIPPMTSISTGLDCKFIYGRWQYVYRSLCWSQAPGFVGMAYTLISLAVLAWIAIGVQFAIWQHLRANRTAWNRDGAQQPLAASITLNKVNEVVVIQ